jgi:hypothetical protein
VLGGAGVASLIGAGVMYGLREGALGSLRTACPPGMDDKLHCSPAVRDSVQGLQSDAQTFTVTAGVLLGVGVVAVGGAGAYWFWTGRAAKKQQPAAVGVSVGPASVHVIGQF